ncbi:MAG: endonuclease III [Clostridia bacterium]|nr:endonuclease III [Clostridia bacterium]
MERELEILRVLEEEYPDAHCELDYETDFQLLVAVILSAQCTDKRVNEVTKTLFTVASTPYDFAKISQEELEKLIFSCGFYRNKAKNIISASQDIVNKFNGQVPKEYDDLLSLAGVGRKTANVVSAVCYSADAVAVDTHVFRVSNRLDLARGKTPYEVEKGLMKVIPVGERAKTHHLLIFHGRYRCKSQNPNCIDCKLKQYCTYENKERKL